MMNKAAQQICEYKPRTEEILKLKMPYALGLNG